MTFAKGVFQPPSPSVASKGDVRRKDAGLFTLDLGGLQRPVWKGFPIPSTPGRLLLWAHRGASAVETENTRAALERAYWDGADGAEVDVQFTKDGVAILFHDETTGRIAADGTDLRISETNWEDLKDLELVGGQKIMTFDELLSDFMPEHPGFLLNVEIKWEPTKAKAKEEWKSTAADVRASGARVAELISAHPQLWGRLYMSSFNPEALRGFRSVNEQIPSALLHSAEFDFMYELAPVARMALWCGAQAIHPKFVTVRDGQMDPRAFAAQSFPVHSYTVDDPELARALEQKGVAGIFTNDPAKMGAKPRRKRGVMPSLSGQ